MMLSHLFLVHQSQVGQKAASDSPQTEWGWEREPGLRFFRFVKIGQQFNTHQHCQSV